MGANPTKLGDLTDASGVKLSALVPADARLVTVRSIGLQDGEVRLRRDVDPGTDWDRGHSLAFQESVEFSVEDLTTHTIASESEGNDVVVSYTVLMGQKG